MKKILLLALLTLVIAYYTFFHFSTPRVLQRRVDSLLSSLNFGIVTLSEHDKAADQFVSHFADSVTFSGEGTIIEGTESREALRERFLEFRSFTKSSNASRTGHFQARILSPTLAEVGTTIELNVTLLGSGTDTRTIPVLLTYQKTKGQWILNKVVTKTRE